MHILCYEAILMLQIFAYYNYAPIILENNARYNYTAKPVLACHFGSISPQAYALDFKNFA